MLQVTVTQKEVNISTVHFNYENSTAQYGYSLLFVLQ